MKIIRTINIEDSAWKIAKEIAKGENRSVSNLFETLLLKKYDEVQRNIKKEK